MVEIDPIVLIGLGSVVIGVVGIILFSSSKTESKSDSSSDSAAKPSKTSAKPKKKTKSKSKSVDASSASEVSGEEGMARLKKIEKVVVAEKKVIAVVTEPEAEPEVLEPEVVEVSKKSKKVKETSEQKAARMERNRVKQAEINATQIVAESIVAAIEPVEEEPSSPSDDSAPTFDGWAVVEKSKAKGKGKPEEKASESTTSTLSTSAVEEISVVYEETAQVVAEAEEGEFEQVPAKVVEVVVEVAKPPPPPEDYTTEEFVTESRKIGLLIGPKGVTKMGIQNITGAEITMPNIEKGAEVSATIAVSGTAAAVKAAIKAMSELCTKGYANILAPADFIEGNVTIHPKFIADVIGKGGATIKAIQNATGVKITTPPSNAPKVNGAGQPITKVKIGLAGLREQVSIARNTILDLTKYYHTEVTHPGVIHKEMDIPDHYYNYIIGTKGSEIKHIQANYKVQVYIPNDDSFVQNVMIVGEVSNVNAAEKHIIKLMEKVDNIATERAEAEKNALAKWGPGATAVANPTPAASSSSAPQRKRSSSPIPEESNNPEEAWMKEFVAPAGGKGRLNLGSLLPSGLTNRGSTSTAVSTAEASDAAPAVKEEDVAGQGPSISTNPNLPTGSWGTPLPQPAW
jgi:rRNA processing protein Krr1/Pno1